MFHLTIWITILIFIHAQINLKVGQTLASGIEKSEEATEATKEKTSDLAGTAKVKADESAEVAKHKANQVRYSYSSVYTGPHANLDLAGLRWRKGGEA